MIRRLFLLATAVGTLAFGQETQPMRVQLFQTTDQDGPQAGAVAAVGGDHVFINAGPGPIPALARFSAVPVKGAPYSAEAVTESVQVLPDGNRITSKQSSKQYRDSEGRTRTETTIGPSAMWVPENKGLTFINIVDPVSGESYTLNSGEKVAMKMTMPKAADLAGGKAGAKAGAKAMMRTHEAGGTIHFEAAGVDGGPGVAGAMITAGAAEGPAVMTFEHKIMSASAPADMAKNFKTEDLGKQVVEGVECIGIRETMTIPAGQIGNERPLEMVTERWGSPDLGVDVLRKHTDPRNGDTTYRLTNLVRGEQPRSLFEVPADYKVNDFSVETMRKNVVIKAQEAAQPAKQ